MIKDLVKRALLFRANAQKAHTLGVNAFLSPPIQQKDPARDSLTMAVLTMCWNEEAYLRKWVSYYEGHFGRENLYIIAHGNDPIVRDVAHGCHIIPMPRQMVDDTQNRRRARLVESIIGFLLMSHRAVIFGDVDEYIVADPKVGTLTDLVDAKRKSAPSLKPLALNIVAQEGAEPLDMETPIIGQRSYAHSRYQFCKPVVMYQPAVFAAGFHYSSHEPVVGDDLYLMHLHFADRAINEEIHTHRRETFEQNEALHLASGNFRNTWIKTMERFDGYNQKVAGFREVPLDKIAPKLRAEMKKNIVFGNPKRPEHGKTMTFGTVKNNVRIHIPDRFAAVF